MLPNVFDHPEGGFTVPTEFGKNWYKVNSNQKQMKQALFKPRGKIPHKERDAIVVYCVAQPRALFRLDSVGNKYPLLKLYVLKQ